MTIHSRKNYGGLIGLLSIGLVICLILGCKPSHKFVDKLKKNAEKNQHAMQAMNLYEQAKQSYLSGNLDQALRHISESISCKPDVADSLVLRLQINIDMNRSADVLKSAAAGQDVAPQDARFPYYTGIFYERNGHAGQALICYQDAARRDRSSVQYKLAAAEMMIEEKQYKEAENYLTRAVKLHPNAPGLLQTLGALAQIRGNTKLAAIYFSEGLALAPLAKPLQENMAKSCFIMGDYFKALHYLEGLLREPGMEKRFDLLSIAVQCYLKCNRPIEARQGLRKLVKEPGEATYAQLHQMADAAVMLSDWPLLKTAASQMIALRPKVIAGYLALAVFHEKNGNSPAGWMALEEYRLLCPDKTSPLLARYQEALK